MLHRQLNVRLDDQLRDRLEALAFVRRTTALTLTRQAVEEFVDRHRGEPGVAEALAALSAHDAAEAAEARGAVARLRRRAKAAD